MGRPLRGQAPASFKTEHSQSSSSPLAPTELFQHCEREDQAPAHTHTHAHSPSGCTPIGSPGEAEVSLAIKGETASPGALWEERGGGCPRAALRIVREVVPSDPSSGGRPPHRS